MAYRVEHRGVLLSSRESRTDPYVIAGSVSIESAIAERPVGRLAVRVPPGSALAPQDFDEVTIDYPGTPYRAWAERHADLVAYWRLDEAAVTHAVDSSPAGLRTPPVANATPLAFAGGNDLQYRAYRQESAAVPYGAAPEWEHTAGAGLSGTLPALQWDPSSPLRDSCICGLPPLACATCGPRARPTGDCASTRTARMACRMGTGTMTAPAGTIIEDTWHHVAVRRTAAGRELWVDGEMVDSQNGAGAAFDGRAWTMAVAAGNDNANLALDEWGIWSAALDVPALYARANSYRAFGGYVYGIADVTDAGGEDSHVLQIRLAGYGLRLDHSYVRRVYASATGSTVREIVQDVLEQAGVDGAFTSHGVELDDTITRAVYPVESVMAILRSLADLHGAIVTVDEWREIDIVRRNAIEHSPLLLTGGRNGNVASIGRTTQPRFFASRAVVVGRGERGTIEQKATGNGITTRFDATQPIGDVQSITEDGVEQTFTGAGARWTIDQNQQRFELAAGEAAPSTAANGLVFLYTSPRRRWWSRRTRPRPLPLSDSQSRCATWMTASTRPTSRVSLPRPGSTGTTSGLRSSLPSTIPGVVRRIRPGVAPEWTFPRHDLDATRLLVEKVTSSLAPGAQFGDHNVVHRLTATALDYQGDVGDDYRTPYQPPAPRPSMGGTAADPNTTIIRPSNVAVPVSLPINLGGEAGLLINSSAMGDSRRRHLDARFGTRDSCPAGAVLHGAVLAARGAPGWTADRAAVVGCDDGRACRVGSKHRFDHAR